MFSHSVFGQFLLPLYFEMEDGIKVQVAINIVHKGDSAKPFNKMMMGVEYNLNILNLEH